MNFLPLLSACLSLCFFYSGLAHATDCIGPMPATAYLIYLHGNDTVNPGSLELHNRKVLQKIADSMGIRIALPRSPTFCGDDVNTVCWNPSIPTEKNVKDQLNAAKQLSKTCFPDGVSMNILGFSGGGYLANKMLMYCIRDPDILSITTIGAASIPFATNPQDLSACPAVRTIINPKDPTFSDAKIFVQAMQDRHGKIQMDQISAEDEAREIQLDPTFTSAHKVPFYPTEQILEEQLFP